MTQSHDCCERVITEQPCIALNVYARVSQFKVSQMHRISMLTCCSKEPATPSYLNSIAHLSEKVKCADNFKIKQLVKM